MIFSSINVLLSKFTKSIFVRQVCTTTITQAVILLFTVITSAITARYLGPAGKGQLAMVFMVPSMLGMFLGFGLGPSNVYHISAGRLPLHKLTANATSFSVIGTLIGFSIVLFILLFDFLPILLPGISKKYLLLGMIALPLGLFTGNFGAMMQGLQRIYTINILGFLGSILSVVFMSLLLIVLGWGIIGAMIASLSVQSVMLIITGFLLKKEGAQFRPQWDIRVIKPTFNYGLKCYVGNLLQFFNYRLDMFIVNFFLGPAGVGIYGVSVVMAELLWQIPNAASFVIFPKAANSSHETMNRFTPRVFWIILTITTGGAFLLAIFGKLVISLVFSDAFLAAYKPLLVLLPGVVVLGAAKVLTNDIAGRGFPHYNSITSGMSLVATIVLDLILIPKWGIVGAALASTASYSLTFLVSVFFYFSVARMKLA